MNNVAEKLYRLNAWISIQIAFDKPMSVEDLQKINTYIAECIKELRE